MREFVTGQNLGRWREFESQVVINESLFGMFGLPFI